MDCDDPIARIQVVAVEDVQRGDLCLTRVVGSKLRLSEGRWTILVEGVDATQFALFEDAIVINGGTPASIRITRGDFSAAEPPLVKAFGHIGIGCLEPTADTSAAPSTRPVSDRSPVAMALRTQSRASLPWVSRCPDDRYLIPLRRARRLEIQTHNGR